MIRVAIVTISDSVAAGTREDRSGAVLRERTEALGWQVTAQETVPDEVDRIAAVLRNLADSSTSLAHCHHRRNRRFSARCYARSRPHRDRTRDPGIG